MYKDHPAFKAPSDPTLPLWRYLDLTKFVSLLDRQSLYFVRIDKLQDDFEGASPVSNIAQREKIFESKLVAENLSKIIEQMRKNIVVNCWHANEYESAAMWKVYLKSDEGIAIRSTFERLKRSFDGITDQEIYIGLVRYIDYGQEWIHPGNIFYQFVHKRKQFEYEREVRAIVSLSPQVSKGEAYWDTKPVVEHGIYLPVALETLIEQVVVCPTAPYWFFELVESVTRNYGVSTTVAQSELLTTPLY